MVHIEERVIVSGDPFRALVIKPGNVMLLRILVPRCESAERIPAIECVR